MSERDEVIAILDDIEFSDYFEIHGVNTMWSNGKVSRRYQGQDKKGYVKRGEENHRKMIAILVEVRGE